MVRLAGFQKLSMILHGFAVSSAVYLQRCCSLTAAAPGVLSSVHRQLTIRAVCRI